MDEVAAAPGRRPAVSVVVPFAGDAEAAARTVAALARLRLADGDEVVVADNSFGQRRWLGRTAGALPRGRGGRPALLLLRAQPRRRGGGQRVAPVHRRGLPPDPGLLDAYFAEPRSAAASAPSAGRSTSAPRRRRWRRGGRRRARTSTRSAACDSASGRPRRPATCSSAAAPGADVGGFAEGIRLGRRHRVLLAPRRQRGWEIEGRPRGARRAHPPQDDAAAACAPRSPAGRPATRGRTAAIRAPSPPPPGRARRSRGRRSGRPASPITGQLERAQDEAGRRRRRRRAGARLPARQRRAARAPPAPRAGSWSRSTPSRRSRRPSSPARSRALRDAGWRVRVEAAARPAAPAARRRRAGCGSTTSRTRARSTGARRSARLVAATRSRCLARPADAPPAGRADERMPLRGLAPLARRLIATGGRHVHAHFAAPAATHALRAGRLAGRPGQHRRARATTSTPSRSGLAEKLAAAELRRRRLRLHAPRPAGDARPATRAEQVHTRRSWASTASASAAGRPSSGRAHGRRGRPLRREEGLRRPDRGGGARSRRSARDRVVIAGDGPLRPRARARRSASSGSSARSSFRPLRSSDAVRELLEEADLLAMPCVIAADGDRDSMPVVVKEALAMEVPVVATDEVGLPEVVAPEWGRLVPPGDAGRARRRRSPSCSRCPAERRAAMGAAGRAFVLEHCDVAREAARLAELIRASASGSGSRRATTVDAARPGRGAT